MLAERNDAGTAQPESAMLDCKKPHRCPRGYYFAHYPDSCWCIPGGGSWKRDDDATANKQEELPNTQEEAPRFPFDPRVVCLNTLKGRCGGGRVGLWDQHQGKCYCGTPKAKARAEIELDPCAEQDESIIAVDYPAICVQTLNGSCPAGNRGLWDKSAGHCYCGAESQNLSVSAVQPTTADMLIRRLLPQPLKYPTGISNTDWTAIEVTLVLLDEHVKSQTEFHDMCTGAKDPQAYGFKIEIFRKICTPEVTIPVAKPEIEKAQQRVYSALFIDTILVKHNNDFHGACEEAKAPNVIQASLDKTYIVSQLCHQSM
jgi:hypothetical protein